MARVKITKQRSRVAIATRGDVLITLNKINEGKCVRVGITDDAAKKVTDTPFIVPSVDYEMDRCYFEEGTEADGYKLCGNRQGSKKQFSFRISKAKERFWGSVTGSYQLKFDSSEKLYYIDMNKRNDDNNGENN